MAEETLSGKDQGDEQQRTIDEVSKYQGWRQNWSTWRSPGQAQREPVYCLGGVRHKDGMNLIQAFVRNVGTLHVMLRENPISDDHEGGKYRCT
jgi:hypothetical protein